MEEAAGVQEREGARMCVFPERRHHLERKY